MGTRRANDDGGALVLQEMRCQQVHLVAIQAAIWIFILQRGKLLHPQNFP